MIVLRSTVLPQPLSPMMASVWPRGIESVIVAQHLLAAELDAQLVQLDQARSGSRGLGRFGLRALAAIK